MRTQAGSCPRRGGTPLEDIKEKLIRAARQAVAKFGVDGASTRAIADLAKVSDANIYRFFHSREELLYQAYAGSSGEMIHMVSRDIDRLRDNTLGLCLKDCTYLIFMKVWHFLLDDPEICRFHTYYYHSHLFEKNAMDFHNDQVEALTARLLWLFPKEESARCFVITIFPLTYDFAQQVADGRMPSRDKAAGQLFEALYALLLLRAERAPAAARKEGA